MNKFREFLQLTWAYALALTFKVEATGIFIAIAVCHSLHVLVSWWLFQQRKWKKVKL